MFSRKHLLRKWDDVRRLTVRHIKINKALIPAAKEIETVIIIHSHVQPNRFLIIFKAKLYLFELLKYMHSITLILLD